MIYKRCSRCGKRIPSGTKCTCWKSEKRKYKKREGTDAWYHTSEWRKTRDTVISKYNGVDLYALYMHGVFRTADTVHHIVPLKEDWSKRTDMGNLIPVSRYSHNEIEKFYRDGDQAHTQGILYECLRKARKDRGW